jgi:hypothetical protein
MNMDFEKMFEKMLDSLPQKAQDELRQIPVNSFQYRLNALISTHWKQVETPDAMSDMTFDVMFSLVSIVASSSNSNPERFDEGKALTFSALDAIFNAAKDKMIIESTNP